MRSFLSNSLAWLRDSPTLTSVGGTTTDWYIFFFLVKSQCSILHIMIFTIFLKVNSDGRIQVSNGGQHLRIEDAKTYDAGTYTCRFVRICSTYTCLQLWSWKILNQIYLLKLFSFQKYFLPAKNYLDRTDGIDFFVGRMVRANCKETSCLGM